MNPYIEQANQQFVPVYNRYPIVLDHGEGMYLYDTEGKRYLDFGSGIGVCALGYHDPNYTRALQEQMEKSCCTHLIFFIMFRQLKLQSCLIRHQVWSRCFSLTLERKPLKVQLKLLRNIIF